MTEDQQAELIAARHELRTLRSENAALARTVDELERRLLEERRQNERYTGQLIALRRTLSWRATAPIRVVKRGIAATFRNASR